MHGHSINGQAAEALPATADEHENRPASTG
jgi:hypothetical protein